MALPINITKEHLIKAIEKIDVEGIPQDADSQYYDVVYNGKNYPPKVIVSYANIFANGEEINRNSFSGGIGTPCFKLLEKNGFEILQKNMKQTDIPKRYWIEKTIVTGRPDRNEGERALGKALWSPQKSKDGSDIYKNMRLVQRGDIVLHLINNKSISGISIVKEKAIETNGVEGTEWDGPAYLIELDDYILLHPAIDRKHILNESYSNDLLQIANSSEVFFNSKLDLRQGAYLTPCSNELLSLINEVYFKLSANNLPHTNGIKLNSFTSPKMAQINFSYKSFHEKSKEAGLIFSPQLIQRFIASLCTKPFVICSGLSGSGKTKLAQAFVQWICESENQYKIIPVGADWTNREPLLGYPNGLDPKSYVTPDSGALQLILEASKEENQNKPYFMILDEMNLSHVERYFADFLSIMESKEKLKLYSGEKRYSQYTKNNEFDEDYFIPYEIEWPQNLFIIGTVNIDETTYMFSPKVLDRANVIEFRITPKEMDKFFKERKELNMKELFFDKDKSKGGAGQNMAENFFHLAEDKKINKIPEIEGDANVLNKFFEELQNVGSEFGYRSATEIELLITKLGINGFVDGQGQLLTNNTKIDIAIMQKLLPKRHGSRNKLTKVLPVLGGFCLKNKDKIKEDYLDKFVSNGITVEELNEDTNIKYKISFEKICRMYKNAVENGFASYAEA